MGVVDGEPYADPYAVGTGIDVRKFLPRLLLGPCAS